MRVEELAQQFVEETGRVDLVTDYNAGVYTDNGVYRLLRRGSQLLDQLFGEIKGKQTQEIPIVAGEYQVFPHLLRSYDSLFLDLGDGQYQVKEKSERQDRQDNSDQVASRTAGSPEYFSFVAKGRHDAIPLGISLPEPTNNPITGGADTVYPGWTWLTGATFTDWTWMPGGIFKGSVTAPNFLATVKIPVIWKGDIKDYLLHVKGSSYGGPLAGSVEIRFWPTVQGGEAYDAKSLSVTSGKYDFNVMKKMDQADVAAYPAPAEYLSDNVTSPLVVLTVQVTTGTGIVFHINRIAFFREGPMLQLEVPTNSAGTAYVTGLFKEDFLYRAHDRNFWTENFPDELILATSYFLERQMRNKTGMQEKIEDLQRSFLGEEVDLADKETERDEDGMFILEG